MSRLILLVGSAQGGGGHFLLGMVSGFLGLGVCGDTRASGLWLRGRERQQRT